MAIDSTNSKGSADKQDISEVRLQLFRETIAMTHHLLASGKRVPPSALKVLEAAESSEEDVVPKRGLASLGRVHDRLSRLVAPATPRTISLLAEEKQLTHTFSFLGRVPLVRRMMAAALIWLVLFVGLSLSPDVNESGGDILNDAGLSLLMNLLFFVAAAGLGAAFAALFKANRYVVQGTFDPKYESSYWIRFILGIIAGMLLAVLIPVDTGGEMQFGRPLLAMLGGFSAAVVHRILSRLVETVESLVRGSTEDTIAARERAAELRAEEQHAESKLKIATQLIDLRKQLGEGADPEETKKALDRVLGNVMPIEEDDELEVPAGKPVEH